jgi:serine/threonine-protein kinase
MINKYCDFVLVVDKKKKNESDIGQLSVRVLQSPVGENQKPEIVSISSTSQRSLRRLENRNLDIKDIINLGEELGNFLLPNQARKLFINSLERLQPDEGLRLRLKLESSLASIPWEYLYIPVLSGGKRDSTGFCALHPKISLVRHELVSIAPQLNTLPKARRLLVALASPQDKQRLDIAKERANIESALKDIPGIKAEFLEDATAKGLIEQLIPGTDIFHFAGHGQFKRSHLDTSSGSIVLLGEDGNSAPMSTEELVINLRDRGVQLVVLGACETGRRDEQNVFDGVVAALIGAGIPAAVAMQYKIWDESAIAFSRSFYKALAAGLPLDQAVSAGRLAVFNLCNSLPDEQKQQYWRDWGVPVLYWRGEGNFILPAITDERQRQALLNDEVIQALIRAFQKPPTVLSQFQALIQDKTEGFVGREYVFDSVQAFIQQNPKGYFTIIGDPGMGKSAILAKYVQDNGCIAHFNVQLQGLNRADQFLESVCKQLIARYQLPYDPLPSNATRDGEFLGQLLDEVAQKRNGQPVVIAVDALDEVDSGSYRDANILYLPPHLPDRVYFIMTRRRGVEVPLTTYAPMQTISLLDYQIDSERDVRVFIQNRVDGSENLRQRIDERQETIIIFKEKIADKSENNFMYLRYVLLDIEKGLYKDLSLEIFPQGLQDYYDFHWRRMGMTTNPLPDVKIKIVYILGEVKQPVSRQQICDFSGEDTRAVQTVLNEWEQFLHELLKDNQKRYSVYHASFRDFLHRKDILEKTGLTIAGIHLLIAKDQLNKWKNRHHRE